jgi:hypothetical protein|tara:strand:+ start:194 stop:868 length:675 start_codon:yes stop_codon:yes gene_type:complete
MNTKKMLEFITPSEDYLNEWYNTRAWAILSTRKFRESLESGGNELRDLEVSEAVKVYDSLRNLSTPNGHSQKDIQTLLMFKRSMIEKGMPERIPPELHSFLNHAEEEIIMGKSPDVAYRFKGEVSGGSGLDKTNPPEYIFQITNRLLSPDGPSIYKVSILVEGFDVTRVDAQQMRKQFKKQEMWRLQGYVNWRMDQRIDNKTNHVNWTKGQKKNLKRYWGWEVN